MPFQQQPSDTTSSSRPLEFAHVLFMDIVKYSEKSPDQQLEAISLLQRLVLASPDYQEANRSGDIILLSRGDGMALLFLRDVLAPLRCAIGVATQLKERTDVGVRMGINTGPIYRGDDINGRPDASGDGVVLAQRVMDCGDAGHILLSGSMAEILRRTGDWSPFVHDLKGCEIKHGDWIELYNYRDLSVGNRKFPRKVIASHAVALSKRSAAEAGSASRRKHASSHSARTLLSWGGVVAGMALVAFWSLSPKFRDRMLTIYNANRGLFTWGKGSKDSAVSVGAAAAAANNDGVGGPVDVQMYEPSTTLLPGSGVPPAARFPFSGRETVNVGGGGAPAVQDQVDTGRYRNQGRGYAAPPEIIVSTADGRSLFAVSSGSVIEDDGCDDQVRPTKLTLKVAIPFDDAGTRQVRTEYNDRCGSSNEDRPHNASEGDKFTYSVEAKGRLLTVVVYYEDTKPAIEQTFKIRP